MGKGRDQGMLPYYCHYVTMVVLIGTLVNSLDYFHALQIKNNINISLSLGNHTYFFRSSPIYPFVFSDGVLPSIFTSSPNS